MYFTLNMLYICPPLSEKCHKNVLKPPKNSLVNTPDLASVKINGSQMILMRRKTPKKKTFFP